MQLPPKNQKTCEKMSNILTSIGMVCQVVFAFLSEPFGLAIFCGVLFYKHAVATRLKRFLKSSRFPCKIRFGWNAGRIWASAPQITDWEIRVLHRLIVYTTGHRKPTAHRLTAYATGDTCHRLTVYATGPYFFIVRQKLYTPVAIWRSLLPHKCISGLVFCETVEQLLECFRSV